MDEDDEDDAPIPDEAEGQGTLLDTYFREMSTHDLLKPEDEIRIAKAIQAAEVRTWECVLADPEFVDVAITHAAPHLEAPAPTFPKLLLAAAHLRQYPTVTARQAAFQSAVRAAAKRLRAADLDRKAIEATLRKLVRTLTHADKTYLDGVRASHAESTRLRDHFVSSNLRLVVSMAKRFNHSTNNSNGHSNGAMPLADLIQEGNLGLMHAVSRFDYKRGLRFSTYACWWIRHAIGRAVADKARTVRVPVRMLEVCGQLERAKQRLESGLDRTPTTEEIVTEAEVSPITAAVLEACVVGQPVYVDKSIGESGDCTMLDMMIDPESEERTVEDEVADRADVSRMQRLMKRLSKLEIAVLESRFGLGDGKERTLRSIGREYGLSRERIRQIQNDALDRLKALMEDGRE